jgi:hypothetical protein
MKIKMFLLMMLLTSCATLQRSTILEDEFFITNKYVGDFIGYTVVKTKFNEPDMIAIQTNYREIYGLIYAYGTNCKFVKGERLYLTREYFEFNTIYGCWSYIIKTDYDFAPVETQYRVSEFQPDVHELISSWFLPGYMETRTLERKAITIK